MDRGPWTMTCTDYLVLAVGINYSLLGGMLSC